MDKKKFSIILSKIINEEINYSEIEKQNNLIKTLGQSDPLFENKLDKIWNRLDVLMREDNLEMSDLEISEKNKLRDYVDYLSKKGKNPSLWYKRSFTCKNW